MTMDDIARAPRQDRTLFGVPELELLCGQPIGDPDEYPEDWEQWFEHRRTGLTGSDIAAIFGEHPNKKPIDVFYDKRPDLAPPEVLERLKAEKSAKNQRTRMGRYLEPFVATLFARGGNLWPRPGGPMVTVAVPTMRRRDRPWQVISPDRAMYQPERLALALAATDSVEHIDHLGQCDFPDDGEDATVIAVARQLRPDGGAEIKTHGFAAGRYLPDEGEEDDDAEISLPPRLRLQSLWYASGMDQPIWHAAALVDTHLARHWVIHAMPALIDPMLEEAERWFKLHVVDGEVPSPDGSDAFNRHLQSVYRKHDGVILPRRPDADALAEQLREAMVTRKRADNTCKQVRQHLQEIIGSHLGIETVAGKISWLEPDAGKTSWKSVATELAERCGLTDAETEEVVAKHTSEGSRRFYSPQWTRNLK